MKLKLANIRIFKAKNSIERFIEHRASNAKIGRKQTNYPHSMNLFLIKYKNKTKKYRTKAIKTFHCLEIYKRKIN